MDKLKKALSGDDKDEEEGIITQIRDQATLSWATRIKGFIACFVIGILCSVLGSCLLWLSSDGIILFAVFYTFGSLLSLSSTCFLMGPVKQIQRMFAETRIIATIVVFVSMALVLCSALWWDIKPLCLLFIVIEFLALTWYALSYIPFARDAVKKCFTSCMG